MDIYLLLLAPLIFALFIGAVWFFNQRITRRWNRHRANTVEAWEVEGVTFRRGPEGGQVAGLESEGVFKMVREPGFVALTETDLRVTQASRDRQWHLPLGQMTRVSLEPSFLGTRGKVPFIVVHFTPAEEPDALAFQVSDYRPWARAIAKAARVPLKDHSQEAKSK